MPAPKQSGVRVRAIITMNLSNDTIAAFCRYNLIDMQKTGRRAIADMIRGTLVDIGTMGFEEQVHEGANWLDADNADEE